jgi:hypothetical protein
MLVLGLVAGECWCGLARHLELPATKRKVPAPATSPSTSNQQPLGLLQKFGTPCLIRHRRDVDLHVVDRTTARRFREQRGDAGIRGSVGVSTFGGHGSECRDGSAGPRRFQRHLGGADQGSVDRQCTKAGLFVRVLGELVRDGHRLVRLGIALDQRVQFVAQPRRGESQLTHLGVHGRVFLPPDRQAGDHLRQCSA